MCEQSNGRLVYLLSSPVAAEVCWKDDRVRLPSCWWKAFAAIVDVLTGWQETHRDNDKSRGVMHTAAPAPSAAPHDALRS